jgi:iron(III) transport system substrate-binding protein
MRGRCHGGHAWRLSVHIARGVVVNFKSSLFLCGMLFVLLLASCSKSPQSEVVLYTSCDGYLLREIIPVFEKETGIKVKFAGDTEATKTTGLVQRVIAERDRPRADVWWSNEAFGTMKLAEEGLLAPFKPRALAEEFGGTWPLGLRAADDTWYGFGLRARVMVYNVARVRTEDVPKRLRDLTDAKWKGRIGMARPQFGTTRGHMGAIVAACGEHPFREWLTRLKDNGVRLYDGNSAVVRAAAQGEIDVGLTDTDDVIVGQREKWPVAMAIEEDAGSDSSPGLCVVGGCAIPNTVGIVKGAPHPDAAAKLADFLLSARVERVLAQSESRNLPIRAGLAQEMRPALPISGLPVPNLPMTYRSIPAAMKACEEILGD